MRYLLGRVSPEEKVRLDEQYFSDDAEFEELEVAEDELIDQYVKNELSGSDKGEFEKLLASPRISERVEIARLLAQRVAARNPTPATPAPRPWWQRIFGVTKNSGFKPALTFAMILVLLTSVALALQWFRFRSESQQLAAQQQQYAAQQERLRQLEERIKQEELKRKELENDRNAARETNRTLQDDYNRLLQERQSTPDLVAAVFLAPYSGTRGGGGAEEKKINVTKNVRAVKLNLDVEAGDYPRYQAIVQSDATRQSVHHCLNLTPVPQHGRKYIGCLVPASRLTSGTYNVHVDGLNESGEPETFQDYLFHVVAR